MCERVNTQNQSLSLQIDVIRSTKRLIEIMEDFEVKNIHFVCLIDRTTAIE